MSTCPLCQRDWREWSDLWWAWQEDRDRAAERAGKLGITAEQLDTHMNKHRPPQPAKPGTWRSSEYSVAKLSKREMLLLELLQKGAPLSSEDISLFLLGSSKSDQMQISRSLRNLLRQQMVYRLFLEYLPGSGPRPPQPPALFLLGKSARAVLSEKLQKKQEWFESLDDFSSWQDPYRTWQKNHRAAEIFSSLKGLQLRPGGLRSDPAFKISDPLLGSVRLRAESLLEVVWEDMPVGILLFRDQKLEDPQKSIDKALAFAALQRSGQIRQPSLALMIVDSAERGKELLLLAKERTLPQQTLVLLAPWREIETGNPRWRSMHHNHSGHIGDFLRWIQKRGVQNEKSG